jgi:hypothetical protein
MQSSGSVEEPAYKTLIRTPYVQISRALYDPYRRVGLAEPLKAEQHSLTCREEHAKQSAGPTRDRGPAPRVAAGQGCPGRAVHHLRAVVAPLVMPISTVSHFSTASHFSADDRLLRGAMGGASGFWKLRGDTWPAISFSAVHSRTQPFHSRNFSQSPRLWKNN